MGSLEKTVKAATCSERLSARLSSSSPWARPPLNPSTTCRSSSSSPTPPTTWRCSGELPSSRPSLPELSRDLAASGGDGATSGQEDRDGRSGDGDDDGSNYAAPTTYAPPPPTTTTTPPPPPPTTPAYVAPTTVAPVYKPAPVVYKPAPTPAPVVYRPAPKIVYQPQPATYKPAAPYVDQYADTPAVYTWEYAVKDDYTSNDFGAKESRDGYLTNGKYYVALPDGRLQTVTYTVDGGAGYVPVVEYVGEAQYPAEKSPYSA